MEKEALKLMKFGFVRIQSNTLSVICNGYSEEEILSELPNNYKIVNSYTLMNSNTQFNLKQI